METNRRTRTYDGLGITLIYEETNQHLHGSHEWYGSPVYQGLYFWEGLPFLYVYIAGTNW
jgi:hypothetical protein